MSAMHSIPQAAICALGFFQLFATTLLQSGVCRVPADLSPVRLDVSNYHSFDASFWPAFENVFAVARRYVYHSIAVTPAPSKYLSASYTIPTSLPKQWPTMLRCFRSDGHFQVHAI